MSTAVAIQNETFCWSCKSNYNSATREMKVRPQRHSQDLLQICLPLSLFKLAAQYKKCCYHGRRE